MSFDQFVPANVILLHTPWLYDPSTQQSVGALKAGPDWRDPDYPYWAACNLWSESKRAAPRVTDHFLTWSDRMERMLDYDPPQLHDHYHDLSHPHSDTLRNAASIKAQVKDDDHKTASAGGHGHKVSLPRRRLGTDLPPDNVEPDLSRFEPEHFEVSAYYTRRADGPIPKGTLVFSDTDYAVHDGWRNISREGLFMSPGNTTEPWSEVLLKVVGCFPYPQRKGYKEHTHSYEGHNHDLPDKTDVSPDTEEMDERRVGDADFAAVTTHKHNYNDESLSAAPAGVTGTGPNMPRAMTFRLYVCVSDQARWQDGMLLPFLAEDTTRFDKAMNGLDGWKLVDKPVGDSDQLFLQSYGDNSGQLVGHREHSHKYSHSHFLKLEENDDIIGIEVDVEQEYNDRVAPKNHTHMGLIEHSDDSGPAPNVLKARKVNFLRYDGFAAKDR